MMLTEDVDNVWYEYFFVYKGEVADLIYRDVKMRGHGNARQSIRKRYSLL